MDDSQSSAGDIGRAYLLLRVLSEEDRGRFSEKEYRDALETSDGDRDELLRGLAALLDAFMSMLRPGGAMELATDVDADDGPPQDALHMVVPSVVAKLAGTEWMPQQAIPTVAGALTAAALGRSSYGWRAAYGPWQPWELVPWVYAPLYLADLLDFLRGEPGFALGLVEKVLLGGSDG